MAKFCTSVINAMEGVSLTSDHIAKLHPFIDDHTQRVGDVLLANRRRFGQRMNPRKNDLFEWWVRFAEKLRDEGVLCAATRCVHRGKTQKGEPGIQRQIRGRGAVGITRQP